QSHMSAKIVFANGKMRSGRPEDDIRTQCCISVGRAVAYPEIFADFDGKTKSVLLEGRRTERQFRIETIGANGKRRSRIRLEPSGLVVNAISCEVLFWNKSLDSAIS